jgi:pimeloyl-ACP methyl ester carboxylesterase
MRKIFILILLILPFTLIASAQDNAPLPPQELADPGGEFTTIDGVELYYMTRGESENPAVMLLHGFGGSTFTWRDNMDAIANAGYYVVAFDRPPYGLADKSPELAYSPTFYADLTAGLMDTLDIDSAVMVGHSAGGGVITHFAVNYADRVDGLVFVAGAVRPPAVSNDAEATPEADSGGGSPVGGLFEMASALDPESPLAITLVRNFLTPEIFVDILSSAYGDDYVMTNDVAAGYARILSVEGWESAFLNLVTSGNPDDTPLDFAVLRATNVPVLIQWGEDDTWVPLAVGRVLNRFFEDSTLITYPDVGHMPMEEAIDDFNTDLITFLDGISE